MPSPYHESRQPMNAETLRDVGHNIQIDGKICVLCQSSFEVGDEVVAVLRISALQNLTLRFTVERRTGASHQHIYETSSILRPYQCASGKWFKICTCSTYTLKRYRCAVCSRSPDSLLYHPECWHGLEFFRAQLYPSAPPLTWKSAAYFISLFRGRWDLLFETPTPHWGRLDIEGLRRFLPVGSDLIPQNFGKLPLELRQTITESVVLSSQSSKCLIVKAIILLDVARLIFERPVPSRVRFLGNTYANAGDNLGEVIGLDHLGIRKPGSGPCPWYLHRSEMTGKQSSETKIVLLGGLLGLSGFPSDYTLWDTPTLSPFERRTVYCPKIFRSIVVPRIDLGPPQRIRTINLNGKTGLTFLCEALNFNYPLPDIGPVAYRPATDKPCRIRAIHPHDSEDSSAIETFKSLPYSIQDRIMWIYVPLGRIESIWVREKRFRLALVLRTAHSEISIGPYLRPSRTRPNYNQLASGTVESLLYSLPEDGRHIETFGAVVHPMTTATDLSPPESYQPGERDPKVHRNCIETSACLENVRYVQVYENVTDDHTCTGMLFTYQDGSKSCIGERRIGLETTVTRYDNPTYMYRENRSTHPANKDKDLKERDGARFFFSGEVEDEAAIQEYLDGWGSEGTPVQYQSWRQELLSRKVKMTGSIWWLVLPGSYVTSYDRKAFPKFSS